MQPGDSASSICGLEISFSSVPQDIDIKVIPGNQQEGGGEFFDLLRRSHDIKI